MSERSAARTLLARHWNGVSLHIDPVAMAQAVGVRVLVVPMASGTSGQYLGEPLAGIPMIRVNRNDQDLRQRFAVAHALGHHLLGHGAQHPSGPLQYDAVSQDRQAAAANRFALELLIPESLVQRLVFVNGISDVARLASVMKVSEMAVKHRLTDLGIAG